MAGNEKDYQKQRPRAEAGKAIRTKSLGGMFDVMRQVWRAKGSLWSLSSKGSVLGNSYRGEWERDDVNGMERTCMEGR